MAIADLVRLGRNALERLYDALIDPARCERAMAFLLAGYAAIWTLYAVIAKGSQDIHFDMGEMVSWSHEVGLGTPKHPPLAAWLVRAWFDVMPAATWAYYLFAVVLATIALWIAWHVAGRYLPPDKRVVGIVLLSLVPFFGNPPRRMGGTRRRRRRGGNDGQILVDLSAGRACRCGVRRRPPRRIFPVAGTVADGRRWRRPFGATPRLGFYPRL
jgi:hypothetical protein